MSTNPEIPLCGHCWEPTRDTAACERCGEAIDLRGGTGTYRLVARLGEGASGVTFRARRLEDGQPVCVKALSFRGLTSFEAERLFQRETAVLRQLRHAQIPNYIDSFSSGHGRTLALVLVQDLVDGVDLADEIKARRPSVDQVLDTLDELLSILEYLHGLAPPVIHRDIKPKNLMRRRDGRLVLIDFGAVKDAIHASFDPGMSLVGTVGYMAPEQLRGEASTASDLYGVGMVAVFLLSGREPAMLLDDDHTVRWERAVSVSAPVLEWLRAMTHPRASERPASAAEARRMLADARRERPRVETATPAPPATPSRSPATVPSETARSAPPISPRARTPQVGVFGAVLLVLSGALATLGEAPPNILTSVAALLLALGWREVASDHARGARAAFIAMSAHAVGSVLVMASWRLGSLVMGFGLVFYFAATSLFLRARCRSGTAPKGFKAAEILHRFATVAAVYPLAVTIALDVYDQGVLLACAALVLVAHLAAIPVFTEKVPRR